MDQNQDEHEKSFEIIVNATPEKWRDHRITYEQVVQLAFPGSPIDQLFTVTYADKHGKDGSLTPGQGVEIKEGMVFNVLKTNRS